MSIPIRALIAALVKTVAPREQSPLSNVSKNKRGERGNALFSIIKASRLTGRFFFVRLIATIQLIQIVMEVIESLQIGDYQIIQDTERYRFTSDSVLLSRFLRAKKGETVADFCAGSGIVGLHFFAENRDIKQVVLFEMQRELAEMSARTVALNGLGGVFTVENTKVQEIPLQYNETFSLIFCNPPYEKGGFAGRDEGKAPCKKELTLTLEELCLSVKRCLKFGGRFALVHRADRLAEIFYVLRANGLEPKKLQLVAGKQGISPYAALICAVKGGRSGIEVLPTLVNGKEKQA